MGRVPPPVARNLEKAQIDGTVSYTLRRIAAIHAAREGGAPSQTGGSLRLLPWMNRGADQGDAP